MFQMYGRKPENWVHPQPDEAAERVAAAAKEIAASQVKST
jgi:sterol 24-C-methyltransferase